GAVALLTRDAVHAALRRPPEWRTIAEQLEQIGWRSLSIVNLTAFFTGMVLALQLGTYMARFGAKMFVSRIVGMALVRELGPVLTALMIGGRVGAGITAELGTMAVTDQIDAIRALGASPIRNLVVPRLIAVLVMLPVLTIIGDLVGIMGGLLLDLPDRAPRDRRRRRCGPRHHPHRRGRLDHRPHLGFLPDQALPPLVSAPPYIRCRGLEKAFGAKPVLRGLTLDVLTGETLVVLGGSGSGKSVLLKHMNALLMPDAGEVEVDGVVLQRLAEDALVPLRRNVAMLFQQGALFDSLTVGENIAYPLRE